MGQHADDAWNAGHDAELDPDYEEDTAHEKALDAGVDALVKLESTMSHHCHARGCTRPVRPEYLMCGRHWALVPGIIQTNVYKYYRPGQCDDKNPSVAWHKAADAAIGAVALLEGQPIRAHELKALLSYAAYELHDGVLIQRIAALKTRTGQLAIVD